MTELATDVSGFLTYIYIHLSLYIDLYTLILSVSMLIHILISMYIYIPFSEFAGSCVQTDPQSAGVLALPLLHVLPVMYKHLAT